MYHAYKTHPDNASKVWGNCLMSNTKKKERKLFTPETSGVSY